VPCGGGLQEISKKFPGKNKRAYKPFIPLVASQPPTAAATPDLYCLQPHAIGFELFRHLALALPAVGLGTFIGMSMFSKVNDQVFRCSALIIILASGCLMVFA
jgi:hypothetical protein